MSDVLKELPPLMPQFLRKRRAGSPTVGKLMAELGLERPVFFTLVLLHEIEGGYGGGPVTAAQVKLRSRYIYSTRDLLAAPLSVLKEKGLVLEDKEGRLVLSPQARQAVERLHEAARARLAEMRPLPAQELEVLARQLERAVDGVMHDPVLAPSPGTHLAASRSLATFGPDAPAMVRIEQAIYDLWITRDDAHIRAWRDADMEGPPMQVLSLIWSGEATTLNA